ncbi:unnamed protein product [Ophioblennius macclurei]
MFLLGLAVVMLLSVSEAESYVPYVGLPCCRGGSPRKVVRVKECYEQKPRKGCNHHAFLVTSRRGKQWCIDPAAQWLKDKIATAELDCRPDLSLTNHILAEDSSTRSH